MLRARLGNVLVCGAVAAFIVNAAWIVQLSGVSEEQASQTRAAAFWACWFPAGCGPACAPPVCALAVGGCIPTVAGVNGVLVPASTIGTCGPSINPWATCVSFMACGPNINAVCPAFVAGGCPPGACVNTGVGPIGC